MSGYGSQGTLESLLVPCGEGDRQGNHVCLQYLGQEVGASPLSGLRQLTLRGPGHQLSSVDLECIIGEDGDQDDAKNLWKGMGVGQQRPSD